MSTGHVEGEDLEHKSRYTKELQDRGVLVKTIVAMANTRGGRVVLEEILVDPSELDSARLDDMVNKYVAPRVRNIKSQIEQNGTIVIEIPESDAKPHLFTADIRYQQGVKQKIVFSPGQVWVRHSSKNEPASADDVDRMIRQRVSGLLGELALKIENPSFALTADDGIPVHLAARVVGSEDAGAVVTEDDEAVAVQLTDDPSTPRVHINVNQGYPYTTRDLAGILDKNQNWVAGAVRCLNLRSDARYHQAVRTGRTEIHKYSEAARLRLEEEIRKRPTWSAWKEWCERDPTT